MKVRNIEKILVAASCIFLSGCADDMDLSGNDAELYDDSEVSVVELNIPGSDITESADTVSDDNIYADENGGDTGMPADNILRFVDAFGEEYETVIDENIAKHEYDVALFEKEGELLKYQDEKYTSRVGIDVSKYQEKIDWESVRSQGIDFVFIRIGFRGYGEAGTINLDSRFEEHITGAQAAGLDVGVYFFSQAINEEEAVEEAEFVVEQLKDHE